ncbi:MAG: hypothetical protein R6V03_07500 [Kiritimatiellia bacterium]
MKVSELIEKLKGWPQDARVVAPGYEDGLDDITDIEDVFIMPGAHKEHWYYGIHDRLIKDEPGAEKAVGLKTTRRYGDDE